MANFLCSLWPGRLVSARLTAWYAALFSLSLAVLFGFLYWSLDATLRKTNSELLHAKVKEFADTYHDAGIAEIRHDASQKRSDEFLIRVSDSANHTLFASLPYAETLGPAALQALEARPIPPTARLFSLQLSPAGSFDFANTKMKNGDQIQIGRNSQHRRLLLKHFVASCAAVTFPMLLLAIAGGAVMANRALRPLRDLDETVRSIVATGRLDARIAPENTAGELRDLALAFNRMLGKIEALMQGMRGVLDNVAHDLRTPITRLRGTAEMALANPADSAAAREALADCIEESERLMTMLNTLMDISEVETGAMKLNLDQVDLSALTEQLVEVYTPVAEERGVALAALPSGPVPAQADENRLRQAIANLLDTALKYTPAGGRVDAGAATAPGHAAVYVRDTGAGIPPEDLPRIWERLYRGDKSRSQRGLGLGLSLVKAVAQAHGGDCTVRSSPGAGSEFTLSIPARACAFPTQTLKNL